MSSRSASPGSPSRLRIKERKGPDRRIIRVEAWDLDRRRSSVPEKDDARASVFRFLKGGKKREDSVDALWRVETSICSAEEIEVAGLCMQQADRSMMLHISILNIV